MNTIKYYIGQLANNLGKIGFLIFIVSISSISCAPKVKKPNIIVLLVDDAGYADFGFAGSKDLKTPNIDKLAHNGVVFTDAHVTASVCGPSRAGLLSGRYQQRFGFECNPPSENFGLSKSEILLPAALRELGYKTSAFGKWHLGEKEGFNPNDRGFDYFFGFMSGGRSYFFNASDDKPGDVHNLLENNQQQSFDGYLTDVLADKAADYIETNSNEPFFMYWAPNAVHTPMEATTKDLNLFNGHKRQELAAMTWALDRGIGKIIEKLEQKGILENTLIFFLSDNGGAHNNQSSNVPFKGFKGNKFEGGHRVPFFIFWPNKLQEGGKYNGLTSSLDVYATALAAAGGSQNNLDGVDLLPHIKNKNVGSPHKVLYWRKNENAAIREVNLKLIRVERLGHTLYDLNEDILETNNLSKIDTLNTKRLMEQLCIWESKMIAPLWQEGNMWDTITWLIHEDLFLNRQVRVKNLQQLKSMKNAVNEMGVSK